MTVVTLTPELVPALLDTWQAQRTRASANAADTSASWTRPLAERRAIVERAVRATLGRTDGQLRGLAAVRVRPRKRKSAAACPAMTAAGSTSASAGTGLAAPGALRRPRAPATQLAQAS